MKTTELVAIPRTRFCTISQIVTMTGYGRATVHRALKNEQSVSLEVRTEISHAVHKLNRQAISRYETELGRC